MPGGSQAERSEPQLLCGAVSMLGTCEVPGGSPTSESRQAERSSIKEPQLLSSAVSMLGTCEVPGGSPTSESRQAERSSIKEPQLLSSAVSMLGKHEVPGGSLTSELRQVEGSSINEPQLLSSAVSMLGTREVPGGSPTSELRQAERPSIREPSVQCSAQAGQSDVRVKTSREVLRQASLQCSVHTGAQQQSDIGVETGREVFCQGVTTSVQCSGTHEMPGGTLTSESRQVERSSVITEPSLGAEAEYMCANPGSSPTSAGMIGSRSNLTVRISMSRPNSLRCVLARWLAFIWLHYHDSGTMITSRVRR